MQNSQFYIFKLRADAVQTDRQKTNVEQMDDKICTMPYFLGWPHNFPPQTAQSVNNEITSNYEQMLF